MLAMTAGDVDEFIENLGFVDLRCDSIAFTERFEEFAPRLLADLGAHPAPPEVGNILVRQQAIFGNRISESMRKSQ